VRKLADPIGVADGAIQTTVHRFGKHRWIDGGAARLVTFHAGGFGRGSLRHFLVERPERAIEQEEQQNDGAGGSHGWFFEPGPGPESGPVSDRRSDCDSPPGCPLPAVMLEPGVLSSSFTVENLREAI